MSTTVNKYNTPHLHKVIEDGNGDLIFTFKGKHYADKQYIVSSKSNVDNKILNTKNVGTVADNTTVVEHGDGANHVTNITLSNMTLPDIAGGASLEVGSLIYTFPAGIVRVNATYINLATTEVDGNITGDATDIGIGTTLGTTAVATLATASENMLTGQTSDADGTLATTALATSLLINAADNHTVYVNVAGAWTAGGEDALAVTGTITIEWTLLQG